MVSSYAYLMCSLGNLAHYTTTQPVEEMHTLPSHHYYEVFYQLPLHSPPKKFLSRLFSWKTSSPISLQYFDPFVTLTANPLCHSTHTLYFSLWSEDFHSIDRSCKDLCSRLKCSKKYQIFECIWTNFVVILIKF